MVAASCGAWVLVAGLGEEGREGGGRYGLDAVASVNDFDLEGEE